MKGHASTFQNIFPSAIGSSLILSAPSSLRYLETSDVVFYPFFQLFSVEVLIQHEHSHPTWMSGIYCEHIRVTGLQGHFLARALGRWPSQLEANCLRLFPVSAQPGRVPGNGWEGTGAGRKAFIRLRNECSADSGGLATPSGF